jgi:hypothetical protein
MKQWRRRKAARAFDVEFPTDRIDPETAVKLIWDASSVRGLTYVQISQKCGISRATVSDLYHQRRPYIERATHDKIVAGLSDERPPRYTKGQKVLKSDFAWMVRCLQAQGWRREDLIQMLKDAGRPRGFFRHYDTVPLLTRQSAKQIVWLAETIGDRRGPSSQTAKRMQARGFFPLIHYTENGELIESSLTPDQKVLRRRVQSSHGESASSGDGS